MNANLLHSAHVFSPAADKADVHERCECDVSFVEATGKGDRKLSAFFLPNVAAALRFATGQCGSSLVELALLTPLLVLLLAGSIDMGRACYAAIEVAAAANAGAEYGTQNPTDTSGMQNAAVLNSPNLNGLTSTASWGCECSDGTSVSVSCSTTPTCSATVVDYVVVTTSMTYTPTLGFPGVPSSLALKGSARLRAAH